MARFPVGRRPGEVGGDKAVARALLSDLVERGLPSNRALVFVNDRSKALRQATTKTFGELAKIQRWPPPT